MISNGDFRAGSAPASLLRRQFAVPRDVIEVSTDDPRLLELAGHLWPPRAEQGPPAVEPIRIAIQTKAAGADPIPGPEVEERWEVDRDRAALRLLDQLDAVIDVRSGRVEARVARGLAAVQPALASRLLLEIPAAVLLERRGYAVLHAGAIAGPAGAIVIRGGPGTGKSTLVAAAHLAGFDVLGDESILVARDDPDELLAAVRDVTLEPEAVRLLALEHETSPAPRGKARLDLGDPPEPSVRARRRTATVVLGPREGAARLEPFEPGEFARAFTAGAIREEHWGNRPADVTAAWSRSGAWRISGAADLGAALRLLAPLVGHTLVGDIE